MKKLYCFLNTLLFFLFCSSPSLYSQKNPVLTIEGGKITGVNTATDGVLIYKGIPYAAPPVGDLRWKDPQPVVPWGGVKVADTFGPASLQSNQTVGGFYQHEFYQAGDPVRSEDCLYLNVWTPASGQPKKKLPVAMYIHGGGFGSGYGNEIEFDGEAWAKRGVILITVNHRLGSMGFLAHPLLSAENPNHTSGNQGIIDLIAALRWIKNNIAQFGGDSENVTVFGQSAGGVTVGLLCVSPLTKDLIDKAIIMSGSGVLEPGVSEGGVNYLKNVEASTKEVFDFFGMTTLEQMRAYPADSVSGLSAKYRQAMQKKLGISTQNASRTTFGGAPSSQSNNTQVYQSYNQLMGSRTRLAELAAEKASQGSTVSAQSTPARIQNVTPSTPTISSITSSPNIDGYIIKGIFTDEALEGNLLKIPYMIGYVTNDVARLAKGIDKFCLLNEEQGNPPSYAYEFARALPGDDAGAFHSGELWYIFNTLGRSWRPMTPADFALSEKMVDCWTNFAKNGNPNNIGKQDWKPFTKDNQEIHTFDIEK